MPFSDIITKKHFYYNLPSPHTQDKESFTRLCLKSTQTTG